MSASTNKPVSHKLFLAIICILAATPILKIGDVQLLEIFLFLHLLWLTLLLTVRKFRAPLNNLWRSLGMSYAIFFLVALLLALASLRFHFFPPLPTEPFLKQPFILSVARLAELFLGVFHMLYIASILRDSHATRLYAVRFYFWAGFATAVFSILSVPVSLATGLSLGVYNSNFRARGLFNEGGPYGLYLISIIVAALLLYRVGGLTKIQSICASSILIPVFFMSQSKAAIGACFLLFVLSTFISGSLRIKSPLVAVAVVLGAAISIFTTFPQRAVGYAQGAILIEEIGSRIDQSAYGGFGGRVAGAILLPRMIIAHPVTGVGLGNYPLLFNDPKYLEGLPPTDAWELPGMGLAEYAAELGLPLFAYLFILLLAPAWIVSHKKSLFIVMVFALVQPLVNLFGAQLNFYYPWICSGLALGFLDWKRSLRYAPRLHRAKIRALYSPRLDRLLQ